jgi:CHAT domain-containing protein/Flp pilus assembly protein TadD
MLCHILGPRCPRACVWIGPAILACVLVAAPPGRAAEPSSGLVVESVTPASTAARSGFRPGDLLLHWTFRPRDPIEGCPETGTLETDFDLMDLLLEKMPRGELTFEGWSQGHAFSWTLLSTGSLFLGLEARPIMDLDHWERYHQALRDLGASVPEREPLLASLAAEAVPAGSPRLAAWYRVRYATAAAAAGYSEAADRLFAEASELLLRASDPSARAEVLLGWAEQLSARRDFNRARGLWEPALSLERQRDGAALSVAFTLGLLAFHLDAEGDLAASERTWLQRLEILEPLVPEGLEIAKTLDNLGYLALWRGDTTTAQERLNRAEAIERPIATDTILYAGTLTKLALLADRLGDLERAAALHRHALALNAQLSPGSRDHGGSLMNLAIILILRGELATAEDLLRQSVEMFDKPGVEPWIAAWPYANLGSLALYRGNLAAAQSYFELAVSRFRQGPESLELADGYGNLAEIARKQRRFAEARNWEKDALAILERLGVGGIERAACWQEMARIELDGGGDLAAAEAFLRQAEAILDKAGPESPPAEGLGMDRGRLLLQRGRPLEAEALYRQMLSNLERRGFAETKDAAEIRHLLGEAQRQRGNLAAAEASFCRATEILDLQRSRLGGSLESRSWFESEAQSYAFDCLAALADRRRLPEAFHELERSRTRVFLQLLAERDLRFAELPAELKSERARLDAEYDQIQSRLTQPGSEDAGVIAALRARLEDIKAAREALIARLRLRSPRLAALQAPSPLDLASARRALDPGTVLLAYAVGPEWSYLLVVRPSAESGSGLEVHRLPIGKPALENEIAAYRRLLTDPESDLAKLNARASHLYDLLLRPAEKRLLHARRILISPDGPLHLLPWAALRRHDQYLAEWRPIHLTPSITVYEETRRGRRPAGDPGTWRLVAFGDPEYPQKLGATGETFSDSEVRSALRRGLNLEPLPATRDEIREIAELFPDAEVYLGKEATEEHAKQASSHADLLHFASHGLINERFPLDSALALTIPTQPQEGRDNGLLQAWEIFESVRLDASLVTLSACDTALGREMGGEGLLGLTRAFQFAGARTVLASLWGVSDVSTAMLMTRFYTYLRQGKTKDEALRAAQLDLLGSQKAELSHPYHWAGFSLYGDWK